MTILFAKDWAKYPTARPDTTTKNQSFVRLAAVYRSMGVQNHAFILALHNQELKGVDPHSPYLSIEQQLMIAAECKENFWYFIREVVRVPVTGGDPIPLEANRGNIALFWLFFNHITTMLIQIRQTGKSLNTDILMEYILNIAGYNTKINLLTKSDDLRRANVLRLKDLAESLPIYLQMKDATDLNNTEEITVNRLLNRYSTHVSQSAEKAALKVGRGLTTAIFQIDETAYIDHLKKTLGSALGAMGAAIDNARRNGAHYGIVFTTTAGKKDDPSGKFAYKLLQESAVWTEKFFDCKNITELENVIKMASRGGVLRVAAVFNHRMLGKTDAWLLEKVQTSTQTGEDADRDYFNVWTSGGASNPIPLHLLERIAGSVQDVAYTEISPQGYVTRWYIPEDQIELRMAQGQFILGMDTSDASGGDDISLVLIDAQTLDVVACGTYNETNILKLGQWLASWFARFPNFTAIIERRSTGQAVLDILLSMLPAMGIDPFKRIFNTVVNNHAADPDSYAEIKQPMNRRPTNIYERFKKAFGYATSGSGQFSRTALYGGALQLAAKRATDKVYDKPLIDQIMGLITKNGRVDHADGEHDDMVIGWLLCHWMITQAMNLTFYGIDVGALASKANRAQQLDPDQYLMDHEQQMVRKQIESVSERLLKERDEFISMRLEQELRALTNRLVYEEGELFSIDELLTLIKERKKERAKNRMYRIGENSPTTSWGSSYQPPATVTYGI